MPEYRNHKQLCGGEIHAAEFTVKYLVIIINLGLGVNKLLDVQGLRDHDSHGGRRVGQCNFFKFVLMALLVLSDKE